VSFHAAEDNWFFSLHIKSLHSSKDIIKIWFKVIHQYCFGNEHLRKLPRGEVYDILIIKTDKKVEGTKVISTIWQVQHAKSPPPYGTILTLLWVTWTITHYDNLYWIFLTRILYIKIIFIYKKTRFSKTKSIDVHCHGGDKKARSETFLKK
jgi:hypothetical protein